MSPEVSFNDHASKPLPEIPGSSIFSKVWNSYLGKMGVISLGILLLVISTNAAVVTVALYKASNTELGDVILKTLSVNNMCDKDVSMELKGKVKKRKAFDFFLVNVPNSINVRIHFPDAKDSSGSDLPHFVSIKIPSFSFGRGHLSFDFSGPNAIKISPNREFKLKHLAEYLLNDAIESKKVVIEFQGTLQTNSYWIPLSYNLKNKVEVAFNTKGLSSQSSSDQKLIDVSTIMLINTKTDDNYDQLDVQVDVQLQRQMIPQYLNVEFPSVGFEIGFRKPNLGHDQIFPVATIKSDSFILSRYTSNLAVHIRLSCEHKDALLDLLRKVKNGADDIELTIRGISQPDSEICELDGKCHLCGFQGLLNTLEVSKPYSDFGKMMPKSSAFSAQPTKMHESPEIVSVGLIGVQQVEGVPKFTFEVGISKDFISSAIGYDIRKIRGTLPPLALRNILESSTANADLAKLDIEHLGDSESGACINFKISVSFLDAFEASRFVAHLTLVGIESPVQMMNEIGKYRRLYFKGIEDTLLSSIASIYEIDLLASSDPDEASRDFIVPGYSFDPPADGSSLVASHSISGSLSQNESIVELNLACKLNSEPLVKNPVVRFYWGDLDIAFNHPSVELPLVTMNIRKGHFHLSLTPNNPLHLLHGGVLLASIHTSVPPVSSSQQLLDAWKSILYDVANTPDYSNINAVFSIGKQNASVKLAVPPYKLIEGSSTSRESSSKYIKKSQLRVVGLRGSTIQALLKLPAMNVCPPLKKAICSIISFELTIPRIEANVCSLKTDTSFNLMKVGVYPMKVAGSLVDDSFCDLQIEAHYQNPDQDPFISHEHSSEARSNWIPLSTTIVDFEKLLEVFDETAAGTSPSFLTTCNDEDKNNNTPLLNRIIDYAGSSFKFKAPNSAPRIEPISRPAITNFLNDKPVALELKASSSSRHQLEGSFKMVIPEECLPKKNSESLTSVQDEESLMALQWGAISIEIQDGRNSFKISVSQGQVEIRLDEGSVRLGHRANGVSEFTNTFEAKFEVTLDNKSFNSGDIRRLIHNLYSYVKGEKSSHISDKNIGTRSVLMKASMHRFTPKNEASSADSVNSSLVSSLHLKTLISLAKAMAKRAGSRPSHLDDHWGLWKSEVEFLPTSQSRTLEFPCLVPSMCGNGLLYKPSSLQPLFPLKVVVSHFVQLMCESTALGIGRLLSKLDLASHPRKLALSVVTNSDMFVASSVNDIDIVEAHIAADQMRIMRIATIIYPDEVTEGSEVVVQQFKNIMEDRFSISMDLSLAKYYHDVAGLIHHISIDPLFRMALDPIPKYTKLTAEGEEPAPMYQSPLNAYPSTERILKTNLLSTLSCVIIDEMPMGSVVSALGSSSLNISSNLGLPGSPSNDYKMELEVKGMSVPNPSSRVNIRISRAIIATYLFKRDEPLPSDPTDGFNVASGRVEPIEGETYPIIFEASTNHPMLLYGTLSFLADGLDPTNPDDRAIVQKFAARAALGREMKTTMEIEMIDNLLIRMKLDFPARDFDLSFFDAQHSSPDARSINKITQFIYEIGKKVNETMGTVKDKWATFSKWVGSFFGSSDNTQETASPAQDDKEEGKPQTPADMPRTGGKSISDINFALSLRNPADFTMAVNSLKIGITIDDHDGFIQGMPVTAKDKKLKGNLMLAQQVCHPSALKGESPVAQTLEDFLTCSHQSPARELAPNEHLLDNSRLLAPVSFEKKINYAQAIDEIVNHDGLCLDIEGTFSMGILDNADGRFHLDLPVDLHRVPIPRVSLSQKPPLDESKKNLKFQAEFDPCFKLLKNAEVTASHELPNKRNLWYSLSSDAVVDLGPSSPLVLAGRTSKSPTASLMLTEKISLHSSLLYEFTFEFKRSYPFHTYPGFAFVWHANEQHTVTGNGEYGCGSIGKSVALGIHPYSSNSVALIRDGHVKLYEKGSAVFPKNYLDRRIHVSLRYLSFDRRFVLDAQGEGDDFVYHSIINIEREPDESPYSRGPSLASMVGASEGWFGITANSTGYLDITMSSFKISAIEPDLTKTKVFWPIELSSLPGESGHFVIRLTDQSDFAMAEASGKLRIKLHRISSSHPRSVIEISDQVTPSKLNTTNDKASLLQFPPVAEAECNLTYRPTLGLYDVYYKASLPGRYAILMSYEEKPWVKVQWSTIYVRHIW